MLDAVVTRTTAALFQLAALAVWTLGAGVARAVENTWDYSVQVSATVQLAPMEITLQWPQDTNATPASYTVYRRMLGATQWGGGMTLSGRTTSYTDANITAGRAYEYRIVKTARLYTGYGYIAVGVRAPLVDHRGKILLLVDDSFRSALAPELARLQQDLAGDGWIVIRRDVSRRAAVPAVKAVIKSVYAADPANVKALFLLGHIPVPYSGQFNPDGHPDHVGAWPADAYYGDMDGVWTDQTVHYIQSLNTDAVDAARMSNVPGDGKFDQTILPSPVELEVGRVDLAHLPGRTAWDGPPSFPSETELLRNYLDKDHRFRHGEINVPRRAVLADYFGRRGGEAFAASGFRNFAPLVGADHIHNLNTEFNDAMGVWIPHLADHDYLLAYGCGAGSYTTIAGLGSTGLYNDGATTELVGYDIRSVFNLLFGSWLGDWDHEDNLLRAPLATSHGLVSVWSGRPHWFMHALGVGYTIGYTARVTMNNAGDYQTQINSAQNRIHVALMGDPTLRLHPVMPVTELRGEVHGPAVALGWSASPDSAIIGYHVYRADRPAGPYVRLTSTPLTTTWFTDAYPPVAATTYMVRAIKLETTPSGSYENPAQGVFWSINEAERTNAMAPVASTPLPPAANRIDGSASPAALTIASSSSSSSAGTASASGGTTSTGRETAPASPESPRADQ